VAGAIHSGLCMVIIILIPLRKMYRLEEFITIEHFENIAKLTIVTGLIVGYAYVNEMGIAWYSVNEYEQGIFLYRFFGHYAPFTWMMMVFNAVVPLSFFLRTVRRNLFCLFLIAVLVNIGMWAERFVIVVSSLGHAFLPYAWGQYRISWVELGITIGSFGWFFLLFLIFIKLFPCVSITEMKETLPPPRKVRTV
jgi:molybdopterin-containing oxidoreductase family membrane subunit